MNISAADDEKSQLEYMQAMLREVCPQDTVYGFRHGAELLKAARDTSCDVAFLDIEMRDCFHFLAMASETVNDYTGKYMARYEWAQFTPTVLTNNRAKE